MLASPFTKLFSSLLETLPTGLLLLFLTFSLFVTEISLLGVINFRINFFCGSTVFAGKLLLLELLPFVVPTLSLDCSVFSCPTFSFATVTTFLVEPSVVSCDTTLSFESLEFSGFASGSKALRLSRSCPFSFTCRKCRASNCYRNL